MIVLNLLTVIFNYMGDVFYVGSTADTAQNWFSSVLDHHLAIGGERIQDHLKFSHPTWKDSL